MQVKCSTDPSYLDFTADTVVCGNYVLLSSYISIIIGRLAPDISRKSAGKQERFSPIIPLYILSFLFGTRLLDFCIYTQAYIIKAKKNIRKCMQ